MTATMYLILLPLVVLLLLSGARSQSCEMDEEQNCLDRTCDNKYPDCEKWASEGACTKQRQHVKFMLNFCKKACDICDFDGNLTELILVLGDRKALETPYGYAQVHPEGEHYGAVATVLEQTKDYIEKEVWVEPAYANTAYACRMMDVSCAYWAAVGECEKNYNYMFAKCAPVCRLCHLFDHDTRCPSDPTIPKALPKPGALNELFTRITSRFSGTKDSASEPYELTILSKPKNIVLNTDDPDKAETDIMDGPWIITLDNFLTDAECNRFIEYGAELGFMDSINYIADKASMGRTSKQAWCRAACTRDPAMMSVEAKIEALTQIPANHSEYFQILKYDIGEYYKPHNDYNPTHKSKQCGVRSLTVFLYLNTVEAGGETDFPDLGISVKPKKGRVVIWPSVLDEDPDSQENRTLHQALPVEKGVKFGANVWIHQREYRHENDHGCT